MISNSSPKLSFYLFADDINMLFSGKNLKSIKDVLLKLQLSLVICKEQCFDGASNMMGHKTGVAERIQVL